MSLTAHPASDASLPLPPCRHIRINLGDPAIVKHTLDEQAAMYVLDQGYTEDVRLSNLKLCMGGVGVLLTLVAQFYPLPFPESAAFLKTCVWVYFALQAVLQLVHLLVEKDCILLTKRRTDTQTSAETAAATPAAATGAKGKKGASTKKKTVAADADSSSSSSSNSSESSPSPLSLPPYAVSLSACLERYSTDYTLTLATRSSESLSASLRGSSASANLGTISAAGVPQVSVSTVMQITDFFDTNGVLLMERYQSSMRALMQSFADEVERVQRAPARAGRTSANAKKVL